jgi:hypothetical protein
MRVKPGSSGGTIGPFALPKGGHLALVPRIDTFR